MSTRLKPELLTVDNLNPFANKTSCTGNRMEMFSQELFNKQFESIFGNDQKQPKPQIVTK